MIFAFETGKSDKVDSFLDKASARFGMGLFGKIWRKPFGSYGLLVVVHLEPMFPPVWRYLALGIVGGVYVFQGVSAWMCLGAIPMVLELFLLPSVQFRLMKRGLRKHGYNGRIVKLTAPETMRLIFDG